MKMYFSVPTYTTVDSYYPMTDTYDYWTSLVSYIIKKVDVIEIHSWNDEQPIIKELNVKVGKHFEISKEENLTVFKGKITDEVQELLLRNYLDQDRKFKWFSIFFKIGNEIYLSSEHWATEFFASDVNEEIIEFIESVMPRETIFHRYK